MNKTSQPTYFDLGASLYTPCTHPKLTQLLSSGYDGVRSMIFCLEDSVSEDDLSAALANLQTALASLNPMSNSLLRFIRPRNASVLTEILQWADTDKVHGFVLPKADLNTLPRYLDVLSSHARRRFVLMPTLESEHVLDYLALPALRKNIQKFGESIITIRIGGNDLMSLIGLKRLPGVIIYDTPLRATLDHLVLTFRPHGFELSSPVFDCVEDQQTLVREVMYDLSYGFFAKTAVHPSQVPLIEVAYTTFAAIHQAQSDSLLDNAAAPVFRFEGQMMEISCHAHWARRIRSLIETFHA